jgi:membrane fusion protein, multidrug efflux system
VRGPVTLGILHPSIVLPLDWEEWDAAKLEAVLAHERSHIRRHDPLLQVLSAMHRAVLWHSPLSWFLHSRIVRVAEEASDDAAVAATRDRAFYAEVLLGFVGNAEGLGVPMARYGRPDERIHRILDETVLSRGVTRWSIAAILVLGLPLAYLAAAAGPQSARQKAAPAAPVQKMAANAAPVEERQAASPAAPAKAQGAGTFLLLGNVVPFNTVTVKSRIDGQLLSVSFKEGDLVQQGQLLATVDTQPYEIQLEQAEAQVAQDQAALTNAQQELAHTQKYSNGDDSYRQQIRSQSATATQLQGRLQADGAAVQGAKLEVSYGHIVAPITGVVGLRLIDPGNVVHATDATGIVVITQLQPIAVVFAIPEDDLPQVRARLAGGRDLTVEAWNREGTARIATGRLTAVDNQIDADSGTARLKAVFDNRDGALFPNQFVTVRMNSGLR